MNPPAPLNYIEHTNTLGACSFITVGETIVCVNTAGSSVCCWNYFSCAARGGEALSQTCKL